MTIKGRNRYSNTARTTITVKQGLEPALVIEGGYIETRSHGAFTIQAKHLTATDAEGDSCYVASLDGAGLTFTGMLGSRMTFTGALFSAKWVTAAEEAALIEMRHDKRLPFTPPVKRWQPGVYEIEVRYHADKPEES